MRYTQISDSQRWDGIARLRHSSGTKKKKRKHRSRSNLRSDELWRFWINVENIRVYKLYNCLYFFALHTPELHQDSQEIVDHQPRSFQRSITSFLVILVWTSGIRISGIASFYLYRGARVSFLRREEDEQRSPYRPAGGPVISLRFDGWFSCRCNNSRGYIPGHRCHWPLGRQFSRDWRSTIFSERSVKRRGRLCAPSIARSSPDRSTPANAPETLRSGAFIAEQFNRTWLHEQSLVSEAARFNMFFAPAVCQLLDYPS